MGDSLLFSALSSRSWEIRWAALSLDASSIGVSSEAEDVESIDMDGELFGNSSSAIVLLSCLCLSLREGHCFVVSVLTVMSAADGSCNLQVVAGGCTQASEAGEF